MPVVYSDQLLLAARQVHVLYSDQLLCAAHCIHLLSNHDKLFMVKVKNTWAQSNQQIDSQNSDKIRKSHIDFRIFLRFSLFLLVYIKFNLLTLRKNKNNNLMFRNKKTWANQKTLIISKKTLPFSL